MLCACDTGTLWHGARLELLLLKNSEKKEICATCSAYGGEEKLIQGFGEKTDGKRQLWRPRHRWHNNIKMDVQEVGGGVMDCLELSQERERRRAVVNAVMNIRVP